MNVVEAFTDFTLEEFDSMVKKDIPFILRQTNFGPCLQNWTVDNLCKKLPDNQVIVHVSDSPLLNFIDKNFKYCVYNFVEFLKKCADDGKQYYYLRSIGNDKCRKDIASLKNDFPAIANDVKYPDFLNICQNDTCPKENCIKRHIFSTVLRISSRDLSLWTHYDVFDNILLQVKGRKKIILFPPNKAPYLYLKGDKSEIIDLDDPDIYVNYPLFKNATKYECYLEEGDALFIPSMWFHNTKALEFSIGVNFFLKNLELDLYYDRTDVYGNKDLIPAVNAYKNIDKALNHLSRLPNKYREFYISMIISKLNKELRLF